MNTPRDQIPRERAKGTYLKIGRDFDDSATRDLVRSSACR